MDVPKEREDFAGSHSISRTTRILSIYHLFLTYREVSYKELADQLGIGKKMASRDISLLKKAGVLKVRYDRGSQAFIPVDLNLFPIAQLESRQKQRNLEKLRRCCILMKRMQEEFGPGDRLPYWPLWVRGNMSKADFYRETLPGVQTVPAKGILTSWRIWDMKSAISLLRKMHYLRKNQKAPGAIRHWEPTNCPYFRLCPIKKNFR